MMFIRVFKHLLPRGRAWRLTVDKQLRRFFEGLAGTGDEVKEFFDSVWLDIFPKTTRRLSDWERQFSLRSTGLSEQQRRDRLAAAWRALGGQSPSYIQRTLRENGFDVYVHEWWQTGTEPATGVQGAATPRNPLLHIRREFTRVDLLVECGEAFAACGEEFAESGNSLEPRGYPLVNKVVLTAPDFYALAGEAVAECGEALAACGDFGTFREDEKAYIVPRDPKFWPYFLYIGGETFGETATVDPKRRAEFEELCLKICPAQQWLGILVEYT